MVRSFSGWTKKAEELARAADRGNYRAAGKPHTWNALSFASLYSQMISFAIVKLTAMSIVKAVDRAITAAQAAAGET